MENRNARKKAVAMGLAVAVLCPAAQAGPSESNVYLGLGMGLANMEPETNNTGYSIDDGRDFGFKLYVGHDFSDRISGEIFYADLGQVELNPTGHIEYQDIAVSGLYYFYQPEQQEKGLRLFGRAGVGRMLNSANVPYNTEKDYQLNYGAGFEYGLGSGYALRLEADLFDKDAQLVTVGLVKRFGQTKEPLNPDLDGDGVLNEQDKCPGTVPGTPVDSVGCRVNPDLDGDGVLNEQDQCPNSEPGIQVDAVGCRINPDLDGDGVLNEQDQCPDTELGTKVGADGCLLKETVVLTGVTFALNSDELAVSSHETLDAVAKTLGRYPEMRVEIAGYTDDQGSQKYNQKLSQRRAESVRRYLIERGIAAGRLTAKGYGKADPIADNATAEGRAQNRRVEMHKI